MPTANIGDVSLHYEEKGQGEPVLLVPPSWWPAATWNIGVVPALRQTYRTIIFDCRGTGRSSKPKDGYTVQQFAHDGIALLSQLKISRCHVVGFALGGQIVQAMAIARPDLAATLTMAAAGPGSKTLSGGPRDLSPEAAREIGEIGFQQYIKSHIDNDGMAFNPAFYREHRDLATALADALWSGQSTVEQFRYHEQARLTWDALAKAPEVKVPTLILCGADDDVNRRGSTPVGTARRLGELVPGAKLALVPNVRHMTFWDGDGALKALQGFLARHPIRGS
ncbi:MAG TPA: alpha/beta fold hydrolase [Candidatus Binatia bacterium]|nr:alpha/beta fold hydrolase [Candidatus Binatia bacterium]